MLPASTALGENTNVAIHHCQTMCDQGSTRVNDILHQFPFSLPYSGAAGRDSGATVAQGADGRWWPAGSDSSAYTHALYIHSDYTHPEAISYKTNGFSVRCDQGSTRVNDILHQFPFSLPYSGYVNRTDGKVYNQGTHGFFWSAGSASATLARALGINGNYTYPEGSAYKTDGLSVRCVAEKRAVGTALEVCF